jgi:hypothetical protein
MDRTVVRLATACCAVVLLAGACGNSSGEQAGPDGDGPAAGSATVTDEERDTFVELSGVPGVTDDEIAYTVIGTKTGNPLGICILDCYADGIRAYFAFRNSEGGIYGRQLVLDEVVDDELAQNQQRSLDVVSSDDAFGVFQATLLASGWGALDQAGVPTYAWGIHATEAAHRPSIFPSTVVRCADCPRPMVPWVAKQEGATKAASLGYGATENSKVCAQMVAESFRRHEDTFGVEMVYEKDDLQYGLPNGIGPEVTAMKELGVDFISTCIDLNGMKSLAQELARQGMADDVVLYHPNSYDHTFIEEGGELFEGDIVTVQFRPFEVDPGNSTMEDYRHWMEEIGREPSELSMVGWINASTAFDGLLAAGPEFDRQKVIDATNALEGYTAGGLIRELDWGTAHTPFTAADPRPDRPECSALVRVEGGRFVPYGDPSTPWVCWDSWDTDQTEPTLRDFG